MTNSPHRARKKDTELQQAPLSLQTPASSDSSTSSPTQTEPSNFSSEVSDILLSIDKNLKTLNARIPVFKLLLKEFQEIKHLS